MWLMEEIIKYAFLGGIVYYILHPHTWPFQ